MALYAFDGTWQRGKEGDDPAIVAANTNVFRFFQSYDRRNRVRPRANDLYVEGIGTRFDKVGKVLGGVFGLGELPRLLEAYAHLCRNWVAGDTLIDIVGFSRGAATTLDFCHIIQERGIRHPDTGVVLDAHPVIRFLGVWDIVAAFGLGNLGNELLNVGHHLELPKANLQYCFHAMALDERRLSFLNTRLAGACEVWFRGAHADVGGGNANGVIHDITLRWMLRKARAAGLPIDEADIPSPVIAGPLVPLAAADLPFNIRRVDALDRCHHTVAPLTGWLTPPDTCPRETEADEAHAAEVGDLGIDTTAPETEVRVRAMWNTARAVAQAGDVDITPVREALLMLFESRSRLVTDDASLRRALEGTQRLMATTVLGAKRRGFHVLAEYFLNEALFESPHLFPFTN